jgi:hypothetical protein
VLSDQGHWAAAKDLLDDARETWSDTGHRHGVAWVAGLEGRLLARRGEVDEAEAMLRRAESMHREVGAVGDAAQVLQWLAERHVLAAAPARALDVLETGADDGSPMARRVRASAMILAGDSAAERLALDAYEGARDDDPYEHVLIGDVLGLAFSRKDLVQECAPTRRRLGVVRTAVLPAAYR